MKPRRSEKQARPSRASTPSLAAIAFCCALAVGQLGISCFCPSAFAADASTPRSTLAAPLETLRVRGGEHKDYNRLVFDWPRATTWKVERRGDTVVILFSRAARVEIEAAVRELPHIRRISTSIKNGKELVVKVTLAPHMAIHPFDDPPRFVLDISTAGKSEARPAKADSSSGAAPRAPAQKPLAAAKPEDSEQQSPAIREEPRQSPQASEEPPAPGDMPAVSSSAQSQASQPASPATGFILTDTPAIIATLDPQIESAIALFVRGNYAYIVFDRKLGIPADKINGAFAPNLARLESIDAADTSVFRFPVPQTVDLRVGRNGTAWRILASKKTQSFPLGLPIVPDPNFSLGGRLIVSVSDPGPAIVFHDPIVGDQLFVVPTQNPTEAVQVYRHYVDLDILPAAQGIVVNPRVDEVRVRDIADGIEITTPQGLHLSTPQSGGGTAGSALRTAGRIFDWEKWRQDTDHNTFTELRQRMQLAIVNAPQSERDRARLDLARFYLANGYGYEASGLLQLIGQSVPDLAGRPEFMALKAAAEISSDHVQAGIEDLDKSSLQNEGEGKLWLAVAFAKLRDWKDAAPLFAAERSELETYPRPFFHDFALLAAESWIAVKDYAAGANMLDQMIARSDGDAVQDPKVLYLRGVVQSYNGSLDAAEASWKQAAASNDRLPRTRAELALTDLYLAKKKINATEAAERLERLRYAWRGDDLEFDILHRLGLFELAAGRYSDALHTLSEAVTLYPNNPDVADVTDKMRQIYHDIFLTDLGRGLSPLNALTLYQQYKDLSPSNEESDKLALKIAEKLIDIDLLDNAADVLQAQVNKRAPGMDKSRLGLQLAAIYLLNHQPDKAIAALDSSDWSNMDSKLRDGRKLLRARALSDQGKQTEALTVIGDDQSSPALRLKADAAWRAKDWPAAAKYLGQLIALSSAAPAPPAPAGAAADPGGKGPDDSDLAANRDQFILNRAIALALAHDMQGLDQIGRQFGDQMKNSPEASAFELLTQPDKINGAFNMNDVQSQMANVDLFRSFLEGYRKPAPQQPSAPSGP